MRLSVILALAALPAAALAQPTTPQPSVLVKTEAPQRGSLPRTIEAYGTIQAGPDGGSETISLLRGGQVVSVATYAGQAVHKGQTLLVVRADPAALAGYRQATAALALARGDRARLAQMLAQHLATRDQLAQADKAVTDAQTALEALNRAGGAAAEQTAAAPFDGIVSALLVAPGARVAAQAGLLTVLRSARLVASVGVEPAQQAIVAAGQQAKIIARLWDRRTSKAASSRSVRCWMRRAAWFLSWSIRRISLHLVRVGPHSATGLIAGSPVRVAIEVGRMTGWLVPPRCRC